MKDIFRKVAHKSAEWMGSAWAFTISTLVIIIWLLSGPLFDYSDTWQLYINTATTVLTFLAVFLIQNTQNRDAKAIHLKLDELLRAEKSARNSLVDLEDLSEEELNRLQKEFEQLRDKAKKQSKGD